MEIRVKEITPVEVQEKLKNGEEVQLIDVREAEEWNEGHIPQATWIPMNSLPARLDELDKEKPIIMVCRSGVRSHRTTEYLTQLGYDAANMVGGMLAWPGDVEK
jgi:rhodanese-related sulfurtransferase